MVNRRWRSSVQSCRAFSKPDIGSDHQLVMAGIKIKLKTTNGRGKVKRFDVDKLSNLAVQQQYQRTLNLKWKEAEEEETLETVEDIWKTVKMVYTETASEVLGIQEKKKSSPWISKEILD